MRSALDALFPALAAEGYEIVGEPTGAYNCIAYAAGVTRGWWTHIVDDEDYHWPAHASRTPSIASLVAVFAGLGYEPAADASLEDGYDKVALYQRNGEWQHAARQMPNGRWRSKVGDGPVIEHRTPQSLAGAFYGEVHCIMRRRRTPA